jgi:hypothetical protein
MGDREAGLATQYVPCGRGCAGVLRQLINTDWLKLLTGDTVTE